MTALDVPTGDGDTGSVHGTAERARDRLGSLATSGLDLPAFYEGALDILTRAVPFSVGCWAPVDPATLLITGGAKWGGVGDEHDDEYIFHEYEGPDPFTFRAMADRPGGVATARSETGGDLARSARFTELYVPHWDITDEARIELRTDGATWGFLALYREGARSAFTEDEQAYISSIRTALAVGLRAGMLTSSAIEALPTQHGPVVLVVDGAGEIVQASVGAEEGLAALEGAPIGRAPLPLGLRTLVGAARQFALGRYPTLPRMRLRARSGQWVVAHASPMRSRDHAGTDVVITLEEARPPEIIPLVVAAFGLTPREQAVLALVLQGISTAEMARTLHLSAYTIQDHLKLIFEKAGVRSRRELIAKVFYDQYAPRMAAGTGVTPSGWFCT